LQTAVLDHHVVHSGASRQADIADQIEIEVAAGGQPLERRRIERFFIRRRLFGTGIGVNHRAGVHLLGLPVHGD